MPRHDLYLFAYPTAEALRRMALWRDRPGLVRTPVADVRLHATIAMLGSFDETPRALIARIEERLSGLALQPCPIVLDRLVGARNGTLLNASERLDGFAALQERLATVLADILADYGFNPALWARRIKPHVTLGYGGPLMPARPIDPIGWTIDRIWLVESLHGRSAHVVRGSWPREGAPSPATT